MDRNEGIETLIVLRAIDVDPQGLTVTRDRVTVGTGGKRVHHNFAFRRGDIAQFPFDI